MVPVLPLKDLARTMTIQTLLLQREDVSMADANHTIEWLETDHFASVSQDILDIIVRDYPRKLSGKLLVALTPAFTKSLVLADCRGVLSSDLDSLVAKCPKLQKLDLSDCDHLLSDATLFRRLSPLPLTSLSLEGCDSVMDATVEIILLSFPGLKHLCLSMCRNITDEVFFFSDRLQFWRKGKSHSDDHGDGFSIGLVSVDLSGCRSITSTAVRHLASLCGPTLKALNISWTEVDCTALWYLSGYSLWSAVELSMECTENGQTTQSELQSVASVLANSFLGDTKLPIAEKFKKLQLAEDLGPASPSSVKGLQTAGAFGDEIYETPDFASPTSIITDGKISGTKYIHSPDSCKSAHVRTASCPLADKECILENGSGSQRSNNSYDSDVEETIELEDMELSDFVSGVLFKAQQDVHSIESKEPHSGFIDWSGLDNACREEDASSADPHEQSLNHDSQDVDHFVNSIIAKESSSLALEGPFPCDSTVSDNQQSSINCLSCSSNLQRHITTPTDGSVYSSSHSPDNAETSESPPKESNTWFQEEEPTPDTGTTHSKTQMKTDGSPICGKRTSTHTAPSLPSGYVFPQPQRYTPCITSLDIHGITFHNRKLGEACLKAFFLTNPGVEYLSISWKELKDDMLIYIADHAPQLKSLSLTECDNLTSYGIAQASIKCKQLDTINLQGVCFIGDIAVRPALTNGKVSRLNLAETEIADQTLKLISKLMGEGKLQLTHLDLSWCEEITTEGVNALVRHGGTFEKLILRQCPVTEGTLTQVAEKCTNLQELNLSTVTSCSDCNIISLAIRLPNLVKVNISWNMALTDLSTIALLCHCMNLEVLEAAGIKRLTSEPFLPIISRVHRWRRCQALLRLKLHEHQVFSKTGDSYFSSDEEFEDLCLPHRSTIYASKLRHLDLEYCDKVNDTHLAEIVAVCRGSLTIKDYYGQEIGPSWISCQKGKVYMAVDN